MDRERVTPAPESLEVLVSRMRELAGKVTPGEWYESDFDGSVHTDTANTDGTSEVAEMQRSEDVAFVCAVVNERNRLLDSTERMLKYEKERESLLTWALDAADKAQEKADARIDGKDPGPFVRARSRADTLYEVVARANTGFFAASPSPPQKG